MRKTTLLPALGILLAALWATPLSAQQPPSRADEGSGFVLFGVGWFNAGGYRDPIQFDAEWRGAPRAWKLRLNAGAMVNGDGGIYGFFGLRRDFQFGRTWGTSLGIGAGLWHAGSGLDLGGAVQFRTSIEFFVDLSPRSRLALEFYHLSNADLYDENPGSNSVVLVYGRRLK